MKIKKTLPTFAFTLATVAASQFGVELWFENHSDDYLSLHWINPNTEATVPIKTGILPRSAFSANSFLAHQFEVRQEVNPETGLCGNRDEECKIAYFQVTESPNQYFIIENDVKIETVKILPTQQKKHLLDQIDLDAVENPTDTLMECKEQATRRLDELNGVDGTEAIMTQIHKELHDCMTVGLAPSIKSSLNEVEFERSLRLQASEIAENFTCVDVDLESSPDVEMEEWLSPRDGVTRTVHKKLNRTASRIHVIENFASPDECGAMEVEAAKNLHVASTADGKGGTRVSSSRKAMQAGIRPIFTDDGKPLNDNLISILSGRVYEYTNHVLDLNITHHGQEPLMSIQYFGRGKHDIEPDRYTPHCDGLCNGEQHIYGARMATMVIYCTIPEKGGFTNFQNSNVHVKPNSGSAIFFSYFDPLTNVTDNGLTQHSGCPVYEGEKKIITQWVRYGVSTETPHDAFNTLDILISQDGE
uniref:Fe2OG dioxygenase domain-containing protein n=2 Tax=Pseudo-nitzschia australis TaxID=44445 RepID=A0A7S4AD37_9STRA